MPPYKRNDPDQLARDQAAIQKSQQPSIVELVLRMIEDRRARALPQSMGYTGHEPRREGAEEMTLPSSLEGAVTDIAPPPQTSGIRNVSLRTWYDGLFIKAYPPVREFVRGAISGAGIPRSLSEAKEAVAGFGEMLAGPTPAQMAAGPAPLLAAAKAAPAAVRNNPAGALGFAAGMAMGGLDPKDLGALKRAGAARQFGNIEAEMHILEEGRPGGVLDYVIPTREERGAEILKKEVGQPNLEYGLPAMAESMAGEVGLQGAKLGQTAMYGGERWVNTARGWTRIGGRPAQGDFNWILKKHFDVQMEQPPELKNVLPDVLGSRPEVAVAEIKEAGGWARLPTDIEARRVVARHVRQRVAIGKAQTNEIVWLNLHDMRSQSPGKFRYKR